MKLSSIPFEVSGFETTSTYVTEHFIDKIHGHWFNLLTSKATAKYIKNSMNKQI